MTSMGKSIVNFTRLHRETDTPYRTYNFLPPKTIDIARQGAYHLDHHEANTSQKKVDERSNP
jgi:hypothetical protein